MTEVDLKPQSHSKICRGIVLRSGIRSGARLELKNNKFRSTEHKPNDMTVKLDSPKQLLKEEADISGKRETQV